MINGIEFAVRESTNNFERLNPERLCDVRVAIDEASVKGLFRAKVVKDQRGDEQHISDQDLALADYLRMKGYKVFWSDGEVIICWTTT